MSLSHALSQHIVTRTKNFLSRIRPQPARITLQIPHLPHKCGYPQPAQVILPRSRLYTPDKKNKTLVFSTDDTCCLLKHLKRWLCDRQTTLSTHESTSNCNLSCWVSFTVRARAITIIFVTKKNEEEQNCNFRTLMSKRELRQKSLEIRLPVLSKHFLKILEKIEQVWLRIELL